MSLIDSFISQIQPDTKEDRRGGNHSCYLFGQYALLKGAFNSSELDFIIAKTKQLSAEGVAVVPTIEYSKTKDLTDYQNMFLGYVLQRRAKGEELYKEPYFRQSEEEYYSRIDELSTRPQEFFDKFVSDWIKICESGLQIDPSKSSNFFYTPECISFIDIGKSKSNNRREYAFCESAVTLFNGGSYYHFDNHDKHKIILSKLVKSFANQGEDMEKMKSFVQQQFPDIADSVFNEKENCYIPETTKERK